MLTNSIGDFQSFDYINEWKSNLGGVNMYEIRILRSIKLLSAQLIDKLIRIVVGWCNSVIWIQSLIGNDNQTIAKLLLSIIFNIIFGAISLQFIAIIRHRKENTYFDAHFVFSLPLNAHGHIIQHRVARYFTSLIPYSPALLILKSAFDLQQLQLNLSGHIFIPVIPWCGKSLLTLRRF